MKFDVSYSFKLIFPVLVWGVLCITFMSVALLNVCSFNETERNILVGFTISYIIFNIIFTIIKNSGFSMFILPEAKTLNNNIKDKKLLQDLELEQVSQTFNSFYEYSRKCLSFSLISVFVFIFSLAFWQFVYSESSFNVIMIVISGIVITSLLSGFSIFLPQLQFFPIAKQCRDRLASKGRCPIEAKFQSIKVKFFFLFLFFLDTLILYLLTDHTSKTVGFIIFFTGLFMIIFVSLLLIFYLEKAFEDFFDLSKTEFTEDLAIFSTGSLDKEFVNLAKFLNEISIQLYFFKEKTKTSEKEMAKRVEELEKFFEMTLEREERMIQLKQENITLKEKVEELSSKK